MDVSKIKLVIWDLDDTFWKGTLSEGEIIQNENNIQLVKDLTDRGIINTICSKNDLEPTIAKLKELGVYDYFVFLSINWNPKGQRISQMISNMGLRPVNCLFIDDNVVNLNEALFYSKDLMISEPDGIRELINFTKTTPVNDINHKRLKQYVILEEKQKAKEKAGDNLAFLYSSNTQVNIHYDCLNVSERLFELVHRTNQLNFTKFRCSRQEFDDLLRDVSANCGYVTVKDNFGDYGIVGFFAIKNNKLIHFLFSCRTIGQGVEQYVYSKLNYPELDVVGDVISKVERVPAPAWINNAENLQNSQDSSDISLRKQLVNSKILFKGPCDLRATLNYLQNVGDINCEFTYIRANSNQTVYEHNHSAVILDLLLDNQEKKEITDNIGSFDPEIFNGDIFKGNYDIIVLSVVLESNYCVYQNKSNNNIRIVIGDKKYPITDVNNRERYLKYGHAGYVYSPQEIDYICSYYECIGNPPSPEYYISFLKKILGVIPEKTHLCLLLGATKYYKDNDILSLHKKLNDSIKEFSKTNNRISIIEVDNYIKSDRDFLDMVNHYQVHVYYQIAQDLAKIIYEVCHVRIKTISRISYFTKWFASHLSSNNPIRVIFRKIKKTKK